MVARSPVYTVPQPVAAPTLAVLHQIDELHLRYPFAGSRLPRDLRRIQGVIVKRKHVATLMRRMGIATHYHVAEVRAQTRTPRCRPRTSAPR